MCIGLTCLIALLPCLDTGSSSDNSTNNAPKLKRLFLAPLIVDNSAWVLIAADATNERIAFYDHRRHKHHLYGSKAAYERFATNCCLTLRRFLAKSWAAQRKLIGSGKANSSSIGSDPASWTIVSSPPDVPTHVSTLLLVVFVPTQHTYMVLKSINKTNKKTTTTVVSVPSALSHTVTMIE